jgi:signal transduction histidine kinase
MNSSHRPPAHASVFGKLVAIMLGMAACLLMLVSVFFWTVTTYYLVPGSAGTHLSTSTFTERVHTAHLILFTLLFVLMVAVIVIAHAVLRRLLRPLRVLNDGVASFSEGQLDIVLPNQTRDEFGTLTDAFNRMVSRVSGMIRARDQLLLDVSHELRSPVTRLKVALELLPHSDMRTRMARDLTEMEAMVTELLELERLRDGRGIRPSRQDVMPVLTKIVQQFRDRPPGVQIAPTEAQTVLDVDADKLVVVIRNLVENATKYSLPDSRPVEVSIAHDSGSLIIRVTDDGPGIPPADIGSLFEPFFRVDRSRSRKTGGYGLGLSICKRIIEAHGGAIAAHNNPTGRGASFVLTLPSEH